MPPKDMEKMDYKTFFKNSNGNLVPITALTTCGWDQVDGSDILRDMIQSAGFEYTQQQKSKEKSLSPKRILKSGNRTIVFWSDGDKTIVKRSDEDQDDDYFAFCAALAIRIFGSNSKLKRILKENIEIQKPKKALPADGDGNA